MTGTGGIIFKPALANSTIHYRVNDRKTLLAQMRVEACEVDEKVEESELGKFGWVMDPDGNRLKLWQPPEGQ